jgi:prepilin-type processing-associated H-X9-DG protein
MTQIELCVVLGLLGVLFALIIGGVQKVRTAAARASCASRFGQLALASQNYHATRNTFPAGCNDCGLGYDVSRPFHSPGLSWQTALLPYVGESDLDRHVEKAHRTEPFGDTEAHDAIGRSVVRIFLCPTESKEIGAFHDGSHPRALHSYVGVTGTDTVSQNGMLFSGSPVRSTNIHDGASNTILVGERAARSDGETGGWYSAWGTSICPVSQILPAGFFAVLRNSTCGKPGPSLQPGSDESTCSAGHFWSRHPGGAHFAFADGSVRFLRYSAADILPALATRAGGETVVSFD